ncbi:desulfoferrodoxin family protein [uncultured Anaerovibrio sp.]|uniref:desulfoferrodoxin family protein n=1 Tax=uncultured Anaerovibrio sp. TaxID=361586 RepID=UPI0026351785|nr:desulfoferrodoxin family protein [uncultured Anaerovibrio sp.]
MEMRFFKCELCGNVITVIKDGGGPLTCCGQSMKELIPGTTDAAQEKHVPVVNVDGNTVTVKVGSVEHPMTDAHLIEWIAIETNKGCQMKKLIAQDKPEAIFLLGEGENLEATYEYCNLHGLWKA